MTRVVGVLLALASTAFAHPLDEVVQAAYLTLTPHSINLELNLTAGAKIAPQLLKMLDSNGNKSISEQEAKVFAEQVLQHSVTTLNQKKLVWKLSRVMSPKYETLEMGGDVLKIYAEAQTHPQQGGYTLSFLNTFTKLKSMYMANVFVQPSGAWVLNISGQQHLHDNRSLTMRYTLTKP